MRSLLAINRRHSLCVGEVNIKERYSPCAFMHQTMNYVTVAFMIREWSIPKLAMIIIATAFPLCGCRSDMQNQPKMLPLRHTSFFADGRSGRQQVAGTVARSQANRQSYLVTGMQDGEVGNAMPFQVNYTVLQRGQEQFNVYCSPCHSKVGNGKGAIVARI